MLYSLVSRGPIAVIAVGILLTGCSAGLSGRATNAGPGSADSRTELPGFDWSPDRSGGFDPKPCGGTIRCVGGNGSYSTIGAAISAAQKGDIVQVAAGRYSETVVVEGRGLTLLGGFSSDFTTRNPADNETVIDAGGRDSVMRFSDAGDTTIDGFTITGGKAHRDEWGVGHGSGIWVSHSGSVTISRNLIEGNDDGADFNTCDCHTFGGGISAGDNTSLTIADNIVRNNSSLRGAGIAVQGPRAVLERNLVENNHARSDHGGGLYLTGDGMVVRGNLIRSNTIGDQAGYGWGGGGIFYGEASATRPKARFEGNRWVSNEAPSKGSGLFLDDSVEGTVVGDLFYANVCHEAGAGLYIDGGSNFGTIATLSNLTITGSGCGDDVHGSGLYAEGGSHFDLTESIIAANGGVSDVNQCDTCTDAPAAEPGTVNSSIIGGADGAVVIGPDVQINRSPTFKDPSGGDFKVEGTSWGA